MSLFAQIYQDLDKSLRRLGSETDPSELHGTLCGLLCASANLVPTTWLGSLFADREIGDLLVVDIKDHLGELFDLTRTQLNDSDCGLELLLPGEDSAVEARVAALGEWCQGFVIGLNLGGIENFKTLPGDAAEAVQDLLEIARIGSSYDLTGGEDDEAALVELVEFVRVATLLLNEELQTHKPAVVKTTTVH